MKPNASHRPRAPKSRGIPVLKGRAVGYGPETVCPLSCRRPSIRYGCPSTPTTAAGVGEDRDPLATHYTPPARSLWCPDLWHGLGSRWPLCDPYTHTYGHTDAHETDRQTRADIHTKSHTHKRTYTHSNSSSHSHTYIHTHKRTHRYTLIDTQLSLFLTHTYACTQTRKHTYIYLNTININIYTQSRRRAHKDTHMVTHSPFPSLHAAVSCLTTHLYGPFEHLPPVEFSPSPLLPVLMCLPCVIFQPKRNSC